MLFWGTSRTRMRTIARTTMTATMIIMMKKKFPGGGRCDLWNRVRLEVYTHEKRLHTCNLRDGFSDIRHPSFHTLNVSGMTYDICGTRCSRATQWFPQSKPERLQESQFVLIFKWNKSIALIWKGKSMMIASKIWCEVEFQQGNRKKERGPHVPLLMADCWFQGPFLPR